MLDEKLVYVGERDLKGLHAQLSALHALGPRVHRLPTLTEVNQNSEKSEINQLLLDTILINQLIGLITR